MNVIPTMPTGNKSQNINFGSYRAFPNQLGNQALKEFKDVTFSLGEHTNYLSSKQYDLLSARLESTRQGGKRMLFSPEEMKELAETEDNRNRMYLDTFASRGIQGEELEKLKQTTSEKFTQKFLEIIKRATDFAD